MELLPVKDIEARLKELSPNGVPRYAQYDGRYRDYLKHWQKEHPDRCRAYRKPSQSRRKARLRNAVGFFTATEWRGLLGLYRNRCAYCGKRNKRLTVDHIVPLVGGGTNTIDNIVPACSRCNSSKGANGWTVQRAMDIVNA